MSVPCVSLADKHNREKLAVSNQIIASLEKGIITCLNETVVGICAGILCTNRKSRNDVLRELTSKPSYYRMCQNIDIGSDALQPCTRYFVRGVWAFNPDSPTRLRQRDDMIELCHYTCEDLGKSVYHVCPISVRCAYRVLTPTLT